MIANQLISDSHIYLRPSDTVSQGLTFMHINYLKHLPVVDKNRLVTLVSEEQLLRYDKDLLIEQIQENANAKFCREEDHIFEVISLLAEEKLTTIPVLDKDDNYVGFITQEDLIQFYANSFSFKEPGSIIVLEVNRRSYSLSEISRIVEMENAAILSTFLNDVQDSSNIMVTLKVNLNEIQPIIKALERYDYTVKASFTEQEYIDDLKERYDMLMSYLNV